MTFQAVGNKHYSIVPVEYTVVQSSFLVEINSNWGSSMPLSTSNGIWGSQVNTKSSVVCDTKIKLEN